MTIRLRVTSFATNVITLSAKYPTSTMQGIIVTSVELHHVLSSMITFDVMKTVES